MLQRFKFGNHKLLQLIRVSDGTFKDLLTASKTFSKNKVSNN